MEEQEEQSQEDQLKKQFKEGSSRARNFLFWVLAVVVIFLNLIPDGIDILLNILNLSGIALLITMPIVWVINSSISLVTFLILLILGSRKFSFLAKRLVVYLIGILAEYIPFINFLPLRTITVMVSIFLTLAEEKVPEVFRKVESVVLALTEEEHPKTFKKQRKHKKHLNRSS